MGCYFKSKNPNDETFLLLPANSLQSQITVWSLILWLGLAVLFIISNYFFIGHNKFEGEITPGFLSILVPFTVLSIITSNILSKKISSTLFKLENIVNEFIKSDKTNIADIRNKIEAINIKSKIKFFEIYEIEKLSDFIMNVIHELHSANRVKLKIF